MKLVVVVLSIFIITASCLAQEHGNPVFVSTQWLAENINNPDLVILHVAFSRKEFTIGHIPHARFLWFDWLAPSTPDANTEMPAVAAAETLFESYGITERSKIILYFTGASISTTTRMYLALTYFGFGSQTSILDGGYEQWKSENRTTSKETQSVTRSTLTLQPVPSVITDADWVKAHLSNPDVAIVDARSKNFYEGTGGGILRKGHIKGAINIPFTTPFDTTNKIKSLASLQSLFDSAGIKRGTKIISYCHVGQQATVIFTVAKILGYDAAVYDGSFEDWNVRDESYPVEKPSAVKEK